MEEGLVVKKIADNFVVRMNENSFTFIARGNLKKDGIFVGDKVIVDIKNNTIEKVLPRHNILVRPNFANLSQMVIVIAKVPKTDFAVLDKLLLFCYSKNIKPVICVNKIDLADDEYLNYVKSNYHFVDLVFTSVFLHKNLEILHNELIGHISVFAGQSAVGKSALLRAIYPSASVKIGSLSNKNKKGKNTTRHVELFYLEKDSFLADTPGFSKLDEKLLEIDAYDLRYFYPDFLSFHENCKYKSCTHTNESENDCAVKKAVKENKLSFERYLRYVDIFKTLKKEQEKWKKWFHFLQNQQKIWKI